MMKLCHWELHSGADDNADVQESPEAQARIVNKALEQSMTDRCQLRWCLQARAASRPPFLMPSPSESLGAAI